MAKSLWSEEKSALYLGNELTRLSGEGALGRVGEVNYNEERLRSSLEYLRPVDYYLGNPQALLAKRKTKLREAAARRREVNRGKKETRLLNGAPELGRSERGAEAKR